MRTINRSDLDGTQHSNAAYLTYRDLGYTQSAANAFDVVGNPSGVINLGTAENQLNASELGDKVH